MPKANTRAAREPAATSERLREDQAIPILLKFNWRNVLARVSIAWPLLLPRPSMPWISTVR